jgi:hypothetical protein
MDFLSTTARALPHEEGPWPKLWGTVSVSLLLLACEFVVRAVIGRQERIPT